LLLAAYHEALEQLASRPIDRVSGRDVWELVERRVTETAPVTMRADALMVLAACAEPVELGVGDLRSANYARTRRPGLSGPSWRNR
jgi:hypothetical protein